MKKNYFIFVDIDGTLFSHKTASVPRSAIMAIEQATKKGHKVFICSGRPRPDINNFYYDIPFEGYILGCGAHIISHDKTIHCKTIAYETIQPIINFLIEHNIGFSLEGVQKNFLYGEAIPIFRQFELRNRKRNDIEDTILDQILEKRNIFPFNKHSVNDLHQILKMSVFANENTYLQEFTKLLIDELHWYIEKDSYANYYMEISLKENTKASGIDKVLELYNSSIDNTIAIGDGLNDIDMIKHAAIGIAMGNACDELKNIADYITDDIDEDGIYNAFNYYKLL